MTESSETKYSERLKLWNSLSDTSNDKIKYLALFDGDEEKAKWAFIREGIKSTHWTKFSAPKFFDMSVESSPTFAKKILSGNIPFWRSYLALIVAPNILFRVLLADQSLSLSALKAALSGYYLLSAVAVILLTASALKLQKEANKYAKIALGLMLLSVGSIIYQTPSAVDIFSANPKSNQSQNSAYIQKLVEDGERIRACKEDVESRLGHCSSYGNPNCSRWTRKAYQDQMRKCNYQ